MRKNIKLFYDTHNAIAIVLTVISIGVLLINSSPAHIKDAIVWSLLIGIGSRMAFNIKDMNLVIGAVFCTATIFIFPWWYIPFICISSQLIHGLSCYIMEPSSNIPQKTLSRNIFGTCNLIIVGVFSCLLRLYLLPVDYISLNQNFIALLIVCSFESGIGLAIIYSELKQKSAITSVLKSIGTHIADTYPIYISYFCMVISIVVMYQDYGYLGVILASSSVFALHMAFDKQAKVVKLEEESYTDILTGVKNKKYYLEELPEEFNSSCAIFFIDFNGFKTINDTYGHDIGDAVIIHGSKILSKVIREKDDVIRFGGDEFMLVLRDADRKTCTHVIERIDTLCQEMIYKENELEIQINMAIGVALSPEEGYIKDELLTIADEKMYEAKKNKVPDKIVFRI